MRKISTKEIVLTGLLTAIAIIIPLIMPPVPPFKIIIPPFSATLASHVPLIISMFISPFAALVTALGSALGFLISLGPIVAARAATHVFFTVIGAIMIKRKYNLFLVIFVTLLLHTLSDMLIVYLLLGVFGITMKGGNQAMTVIQSTIGIGTSIHHLVDFAIALAVYYPLSKSKKLLD